MKEAIKRVAGWQQQKKYRDKLLLESDKKNLIKINMFHYNKKLVKIINKP